jgi:tight adherence protein C
MFTSMSRKVNRMLPSSIEERLSDSIVQAGLKMSPGHFIVVVGVTVGVVPLLIVGFLAAGGQSPKVLAGIWVLLLLVGLYLPRVWLLGRIGRRKKAIWRSLPDAFDLITASVEAGLGIDAAFNRVIEKVEGPFAEELTRTMHEISMGRSRREALQDLASRTGVEELRSFVNSVVQAETMGVSIGTVIRVQTGVIRTKRRQKAEEAAFKAPIKMVFPLVFFIFPTIMVVIGGPAAIQMRDAFTK